MRQVGDDGDRGADGRAEGKAGDERDDAGRIVLEPGHARQERNLDEEGADCRKRAEECRDGNPFRAPASLGCRRMRVMVRSGCGHNRPSVSSIRTVTVGPGFSPDQPLFSSRRADLGARMLRHHQWGIAPRPETDTRTVALQGRKGKHIFAESHSRHAIVTGRPSWQSGVPGGPDVQISACPYACSELSQHLGQANVT